MFKSIQSWLRLISQNISFCTQALFFSRFTTKYVSPQLIKSEMQSVNHSESAIEDLIVSCCTLQMIGLSGLKVNMVWVNCLSEYVTTLLVSYWHEVWQQSFVLVFPSLSLISFLSSLLFRIDLFTWDLKLHTCSLQQIDAGCDKWIHIYFGFIAC